MGAGPSSSRGEAGTGAGAEVGTEHLGDIRGDGAECWGNMPLGPSSGPDSLTITSLGVTPLLPRCLFHPAVPFPTPPTAHPDLASVSSGLMVEDILILICMV